MNNNDRPNVENNNQTRQIPVQKPVNNGQTRQIPVQKPSSEVNRTRQVPKPANTTQTRQVPVPKPADATHTRQMPVQKPADATHTRQVPVQKPAGESTAVVNGDTPSRVRTTPSNGTPKNATPKKPESVAPKKAPIVPANDETRKVPIVETAKENPSGTRIMDKPETETETAEKKKKSLFDTKEDDSDNALLISIIKAVIYIVAVLVISISASIFIILVGNDVFAFVKSDEVVEITVPEDADVGDIASILKDNNIIKYPGIFKWYAAHNEDDGKFIPGKYSVASNLDYDDLLASFKEQKDEGTSWVTIPEGYTTDEIINLMVETGIGTKEGYIDVINNYDFDYWFVKEIPSDWKESGRFYRLDGYLFPDTYEFYNESSERAVIEKLLARFNVIFGKKYREAAETMGMSVDDIVIIASMVEKEAGRAADYHLVSSVFHNRLKSQYFPKMESDATALYAIHHDTGERPTDVTGEHMKYETPYNTYLHEGLPPGAIANPSASSINAAITPENTSYYYFVSDGFNTYFGKTNDEHERNKAMVAAMKK